MSTLGVQVGLHISPIKNFTISLTEKEVWLIAVERDTSCEVGGLQRERKTTLMLGADYKLSFYVQRAASQDF